MIPISKDARNNYHPQGEGKKNPNTMKTRSEFPHTHTHTNPNTMKTRSEFPHRQIAYLQVG